MQINKKTVKGIYTLFTPEKKIPLIIDLPHSGKTIPCDFDFTCDKMLITKSVEMFLDELIETSPSYGASVLIAEFPRSYIDPNRSENDIDNELLKFPWPHKTAQNGKSVAGIGLVRRLMTPEIPIYNRKLSHKEIRCRIENFYRPYHNQLENNIKNLHDNFGYVFHINLHSMPSAIFSQSYNFPFSIPVINNQPDFILGSMDGKTCTDDFLHFCKDTLKSMGYRVYINKIYKGAEIVKKYGNPEHGFNSLQIEINRSIFMNEDKCKKIKNFSKLKTDIDKMIQDVSSYIKDIILHKAAD